MIKSGGFIKKILFKNIRISKNQLFVYFLTK